MFGHQCPNYYDFMGGKKNPVVFFLGFGFVVGFGWLWVFFLCVCFEGFLCLFGFIVCFFFSYYDDSLFNVFRKQKTQSCRWFCALKSKINCSFVLSI